MASIQENVSLKPYNTFGVEALARYFTTLRQKEDLFELIHSKVYSAFPHLILGGGSNILFTHHYEGLVIRTALTGLAVVSQTDSHVDLKVGSGVVWDDVVAYCVDQGWGGIENLSLIPGTAGAAPIQNIGAYGVEIKQVIQTVDVIDMKDGTERSFTNADCQFGYRESAFKGAWKEKYFISSITLRLTKKNHQLSTHYGAITEVLQQRKVSTPSLHDVRDVVIHIRQSKLPDPAVLGNAGSFFKNPTIAVAHLAVIQESYPSMPFYPVDNQYVKVPAGWLIEQCGWKGKKFAKVAVHHQQALVLINLGGATGEEIIALARKISESVREKFNINLVMEVNII